MCHITHMSELCYSHVNHASTLFGAHGNTLQHTATHCNTLQRAPQQILQRTLQRALQRALQRTLHRNATYTATRSHWNIHLKTAQVDDQASVVAV